MYKAVVNMWTTALVFVMYLIKCYKQFSYCNDFYVSITIDILLISSSYAPQLWHNVFYLHLVFASVWSLFVVQPTSQFLQVFPKVENENY